MNHLFAFRKKRSLLFVLYIFLHIAFIEANFCYALSESDMQNPTLLTYEGWKYLNKGGLQNYDKAEEYFQKALKLNINHAEAYAGLGKLVMERDHRPYTDYDKDKCRKALMLFDKAISLDNRAVRAHYNKGEALLCLEDFDAALLAADQLKGQSHDFYECAAHYIKSKAYKGKYLSKKESSSKKMAIVESTDYLECAQSNPDSGNLRFANDLFRDIMRTTKDFNSTEKYFKRNIELKPHSMWSYYNYYNIILLRTDEGFMKNTDMSEVERIIKEGKTNTNFKIGALFEIRYHRGEAYWKKKVYDKALVEYTECLAGFPNYGVTKERISFLCSKFSDDRCIKSWRRIIQAYLDRGDCTNAAEEFKIQYENDSASFEKLKKSVSQCKEKKPEL
jgi:tetratricopeptide (TPR) repeat protein